MEANDSVVVFTPFFDQLLIDIFEQCSLPKSEITLVTQLDWEDSGLKSFNKAKNILEFIQLGINVRILDRLHAKILIVDWDRAMFGSQNFTNYSTQSVEISVEVDRYGDSFEEAFEDFEKLLADSRPLSLSDLH
jgi:phosphatidylserine/phosphatidylglycerophosphate/cardiolipin synthase-like enzyme